ncbi:MAG: siderophore-interacting protein [Polyangiaceae bacterium]|nr:siderophore-interacting protein [Polyangiaceae bacterium]
MARRPIYQVRVAAKDDFSKSLRRIVLQSDSLKSFPQGQEGGYIKLLLPRSNSPVRANLSPSLVNPADFIKRSYTIVSSDESAGTLTIDMVRHGDGGPATRWGEESSLGDEIFITGPGPVKMLSLEADWFFLVGDSAAFPAILANLRRLSPSAQGYVIFEIHSDDEQFETHAPPGIEVHWLKSDALSASLPQKVRELPWLEGRVSVWGAAEFSTMKKLRDYFVKEREVPREDIYISSYWKRGATDEEHKQAKKSD